VVSGLGIEPLTPLNLKWFEIYARASAAWFLQAYASFEILQSVNFLSFCPIAQLNHQCICVFFLQCYAVFTHAGLTTRYRTKRLCIERGIERKDYQVSNEKMQVWLPGIERKEYFCVIKVTRYCCSLWRD